MKLLYARELDAYPLAARRARRSVGVTAAP